MKKLSFYLPMLIFLVSGLPVFAQLTGIWIDDGGSRYRVRQVDDHVFWSVDASPKVINVFYGIIAGDIVTGKWADLPDGRLNGSGTLALKVENPNRMVKIASNGNYGASVWVREGTASPPVTGNQPSQPIQLPQPVEPSSTNKAIEIPGAVDLAVSSTDIWVGHGQYGVYRIPIQSRVPQSFSSDKKVQFITVDQQNQPWIIDTENKVYYHNGSAWINTNAGDCKAICIDKQNRAWVIDYGWWMKYYDESARKWVPVYKNDGRALEVVDQNNMVHANFYQNVFVKKNGGQWEPVPGILMNDLAMSANGRMWGVSNEGKVYEWANGRWEERLAYGKATRIAVDPSGEAYTIKVAEN